MSFLKPCTDKKLLSGQLIVTGIWAVITAFGIYLSPDPHGHGTHQQLGLPPCPSVLFFNKPCPGCGLTTSWTATIHGRLGEAFQAHALGPILYIGLTIFAFINLWAFIKKYHVDTSGKAWMTGIVVGAVIFFGFGFTRFAMTKEYQSPGEVQNFIKKLGAQQAKNETPTQASSK